MGFHSVGQEDQNALIAPFLADVDVTVTGSIFYRETGDGRTLRQGKDFISRYFVRNSNFKPKNMLIVTWDKVGFQGSAAETPKVRNSAELCGFFYYRLLDNAWYTHLAVAFLMGGFLGELLFFKVTVS